MLYDLEISSVALIHPPPLSVSDPCLSPLAAHRKLVATFLEANGRGYWEATDEQLEKLRKLYSEVEDKIEGVE